MSHRSRIEKIENKRPDRWKVILPVFRDADGEEVKFLAEDNDRITTVEYGDELVVDRLVEEEIYKFDCRARRMAMDQIKNAYIMNGWVYAVL